MTHRSHELFEFAQMEPLAVADMAMMLRECDEDEIGQVEQIADNLTKAIALMEMPVSEFAEYLFSDN